MPDWEFKIVRCNRPAFSRRAFLDQVLAEEAGAGWQLAELLDGQRLRLKRAKSGRVGEVSLPEGYDEYRLEVVDPVSNAKAFQWVWWIFCGASSLVLLWGLVFMVFNGLHPAGIIAAAVGAALLLLFGYLAQRCGARLKKLAHANRDTTSE